MVALTYCNLQTFFNKQLLTLIRGEFSLKTVDRSGVHRIFTVLTEHNQMEKILLFSEVILSNIKVFIMKQLLQVH